MALKKHFFPYGSFSIKDRYEIRFWEDKWLENTALREQYLALDNIVRHKGDTLAKVMKSSPPNMTFRRNLVGPPCILECIATTFVFRPFDTRS
jgi:hypothetical protein